MPSLHRQIITQLLSNAVGSLLPEGQVRLKIILERSKQAAHGDITCDVTLQLAKPLGTSPCELVDKVADATRIDARGQRLVVAAEIAGPGSISLRLSTVMRADVIAAMFAEGDRYGAANMHDDASVPMESALANPAGPLHVGHGCQAALGDALTSLLDWQGYKVHRKLYYNDAGVQIHNLAILAQARARGYKPGDANWPETAYNGDCIADIAIDYLAGRIVRASDCKPMIGGRDIGNIEAIRRFAVMYPCSKQDIDLRVFGVKFDHYYPESSFYTEGKVQQTVDTLVAAGKTYEQEGTLWLRTTDDGDDKGRVMRKSDGAYTYFVPGVAYHTTKRGRGFTQVISVQGSDHHGTITRVHAGPQGLNIGIPKGYPDYILRKMATVMKDDAEVKISKRAGLYMTMYDLIEWFDGDTESEAGVNTIRACVEAGEPNWPACFVCNRDAVHFLLLSCKADTEFVFDVGLALKQSNENPVCYVQHAHTHICSVFGHTGVDVASLISADLAAVTGPDANPQATALAQCLATFLDTLAGAAHELAPYTVALYPRSPAGDLHASYSADCVSIDGGAVKRARLALLATTRQVLRNGLMVVGVSAPQKM